MRGGEEAQTLTWSFINPTIQNDSFFLRDFRTFTAALVSKSCSVAFISVSPHNLSGDVKVDQADQ